MCGGGPPPGTSWDSAALTTPFVSRPCMRMTIGMPRTLIFLPPSDGIWIGFINIRSDLFAAQAGVESSVYSPGIVDDEAPGTICLTAQDIRGFGSQLHGFAV